MTATPSLFGDPAVRRSDPQASHAAAQRAAASLPTVRGVMLTAFLPRGGVSAFTAAEAAEWLVTSKRIPIARMDSHRRRASELATAGLLEGVGWSMESGATIYKLTGPGRMAAAKVVSDLEREAREAGR